ncbi:Periplasmic copper-binding protein (NosD) [uncultured archaeon]|nr:Periplasmic copper-binding protein (NosD) [uncultured archaeon]
MNTTTHSNNGGYGHHYSGQGYGIYLSASYNNTISNITADSNNGYSNWDGGAGYGIYLSASYNNTISNVTADSNNGGNGRPTGGPGGSGYGIYLSSSYNNTISNVTADSNNGGSGNGNGSGYGIYLTSSPDNFIYNNFLNDTIPVQTDGSPNFWNTTLTLGTNIIGGAWIGGNFYAQPDGSGFSENCTTNGSAGSNRICAAPYDILGDGSNIDYLPLTKPLPAPPGNGARSVTISFSMTVSQFIEVQVTPPSISFGSLNPLTNATSSSTVDVTNTNNSNVAIKLTVNGTDFNNTNVPDTIAVGNLRMMANSAQPPAESFSEQVSNIEKECTGAVFRGDEDCSNVVVGSTVNLWFNFFVPGSKKAGVYSSTIDIRSNGLT